MAGKVHWRLMYRVANRAALDKCLARTLPLMERGYILGECKQYWKIPELWECALETPLTAESTAKQLHACLLIAYRLATGWYICGSLSPESANGFEGVFSGGQGAARSNVVGLEWASFGVLMQE